MKIKDEINLDVLLTYGFKKINKEDELKNQQYYISSFHYKYKIGTGVSWNGEYYYLLVNAVSRYVIIYAVKPDGIGTGEMCPDVLIKMCIDGVIDYTPNY